MSDLHDLYQDLILDHARRPRNFGVLPKANVIKEGFNPICGDKLKFYLLADNNVVSKVMFEGVGCAIFMASASLLTQVLPGKNIEEVERLFDSFHALVTDGSVSKNEEDLLGKLMALSGVSAYPVRVKCATLAWHTMRAALHNDQSLITTE